MRVSYKTKPGMIHGENSGLYTVHIPCCLSQVTQVFWFVRKHRLRTLNLNSQLIQQSQDIANADLRTRHPQLASGCNQAEIMEDSLNKALNSLTRITQLHTFGRIMVTAPFTLYRHLTVKNYLASKVTHSNYYRHTQAFPCSHSLKTGPRIQYCCSVQIRNK